MAKQSAPATRWNSQRLRRAAAAWLTLTSASLQPIGAQPAPTFDGRDFGEVALPAGATRGDVVLQAARAWAWTDRSTSRLLLDRDVRVTIGTNTFEARRALVWVEPVEVEGAEADQIAVFFEEALDPTGQAGLSLKADRLLVTAIVLGGTLRLRVDRLERVRPEGDPLLTDGEARLARYLTELTAPPPPPVPPAQELPAPLPLPMPAVPPATTTPSGEPVAPAPPAVAPSPGVQPPPPVVPLTVDGLRPAQVTDARGPLPPAERPAVIEPRGGVLAVAGENVRVTPAGDGTETLVIVSGGMLAQYQLADASRTVQLLAQRAVIFLTRAEGAERLAFDTADVIGVYLEGDAAVSDGRVTLRGNRVYYDVARERGIVLDAVFWTFDEDRGMPLYLRAQALRQGSRDQWSADAVTLANVGFAEPHFSLGADTVTITRGAARPADAPGKGPHVDARGVAFRAGDLSVFGLPRVRGEFRPSVLRALSVESEAGNPILRTEWDLYTLLGFDAAEGNEASLLLDAYIERGPGVGTDITWAAPELGGSLFGYFIYDQGTDRLTSGAEIEHDDDARGMVLADQKWRFDDKWTLSFEGAYIADETFVDAFYEELAETRREFISSVHARRLEANTALTLEARGSFNDFISNEYLLQSRGYITEKLPELAYHRVGDSLFDGLLSSTTDLRYSRVAMRFSDPRLREIGLDTPRRAGAAFGLTPDDRLSDVLKGRGFIDDPVNRFDARQEFEIPLVLGSFNIVPFAVGRFTAWDEEFERFGTIEDDPYRLWGAVGARASMSIVRVDDAVQSRFLDLHRIRHIVEPNATVWQAGTTIDQRELPTYDEEVESLAAGTAFRAGVRNTWQTMRGGAGDERSVDWLTINTDYIWSSGEVDLESPFARFIEARPEASYLGRFFSNDLAWQFTDAVTITSDVLFNTEEGEFARTTVGGLVDHGYGFSTLIEWRELRPIDATYLDVAARYELTRKYAATAFTTYDLNLDEFQSVGFGVIRRFPQWTVSINLSYDNIASETSIGVSLRPAGLGNEDRRRIFTRDPVAAAIVPNAGPRPGRLDFGPFENPR